MEVANYVYIYKDEMKGEVHCCYVIPFIPLNTTYMAS